MIKIVIETTFEWQSVQRMMCYICFVLVEIIVFFFSFDFEIDESCNSSNISYHTSTKLGYDVWLFIFTFEI